MQDIKDYHTFTKLEPVNKGWSSDVLTWFDNMNNPVPTWYLKDFYIQYIDDIP